MKIYDLRLTIYALLFAVGTALCGHGASTLPSTTFTRDWLRSTNYVDGLNRLGMTGASNGFGYAFDTSQFSVDGSSNVAMNAAYSNGIVAAAIAGSAGVSNDQVLPGTVTITNQTWPNEGFPWYLYPDQLSLLLTNAGLDNAFRFNFDNTGLALNNDDVITRQFLPFSIFNYGSRVIFVTTNGMLFGAPGAYNSLPPGTALENGATLLILPGTYDVALGNPTNYSGNAAFRLTQKTNITILGFGRSSTILRATNSIGHLFLFDRCDNITVRGITFDCSEKILVNDGMANAGWSPYGMITLGSCANITVEDCHFANYNNFGILEGADSFSRNPSTNNILILNNTFYNGGAWMTNIEAGVPSNQRFDCAAIACATWTIDGNQIVDCPRGIEPWTKQPAVGGNYVCAPVVKNNVILNATDFGIGGAYMFGGVFENNYIENLKGTNWQGWPASDSTYGNHGIKLDAIANAVLRGNYIRGYSNGIFVTYATNVLAWDNRLVDVSTPSTIQNSDTDVGIQAAGPIIPGMGADVNKVWTCTNATTGEGHWAAAASGTGSTNQTTSGFDDTFAGSVIITSNLTVGGNFSLSGTQTVGTVVATNLILQGAQLSGSTNVAITNFCISNLTNYWDFGTSSYKTYTNGLAFNHWIILTNSAGSIDPGMNMVGTIYGTSTLTNAYSVKFLWPSGKISWLGNCTTNGSSDFLINSNRLALVSLFCDRATNVIAAYSTNYTDVP